MAVVVVGTMIVMLGRGANDRHATDKQLPALLCDSSFGASK
jgi:hypothetical protein